MRGFVRDSAALANDFRGEEGYHDDEAEDVLYAFECVSSSLTAALLILTLQLINVNKMLVDVFRYKAPLLQNIPAIGKPVAVSIQTVDTMLKVSDDPSFSPTVSHAV